MSRLTVSRQVREPIPFSPTVEVRRWQEKRSLGYASLTDDEREILGWSRERRLKEFQKANEGVGAQLLESKLLYIDTLTVGNGEIRDVLRSNPALTWEKVRDFFLGGPAEGYTSTFHTLDDINYPESFWKATIESEKENLLVGDETADYEVGYSIAEADETVVVG